MKKPILKQFTNHMFLKRIGRDLLNEFMRAYPEISSAWPGSNGSQTGSDSDVYSALASLFMRPDLLPGRMTEDLLAIEEMSTEAGLARMQRSLEWSRLKPRLRPDSTAEDIAMQVWLLCPELLAREHNIMRITRMTTFEHAAHPCCGEAICRSEMQSSRRMLNKLNGLNELNAESRYGNAMQPEQAFVHRGTEGVSVDRLAIYNLSQSLDKWFAEHQRGIDTTRIEIFPIQGDSWFMIRHGDVCKRVAKVEKQETHTLHFRPERDDIVVWSGRLDELRVNARTKAERDLYIREFGLHLHGDPAYFSERRPYTLEPLRKLGRDALDAEGINGISRIRLRRVSVRMENAQNESITREADDLFGCRPISAFRGGPIPADGLLERALFEIQFAGSIKSHPVEIRVPNMLKISRRCDPEPVHEWLCVRGFRNVGCSVT